jgi:hypothetical protein
MLPERLEKMLASVVPATAAISAYALVFNAADVEISIFPVIGWRCGDGSLPDCMPVLPGDVEFGAETYDAWALKMPDGQFLAPMSRAMPTRRRGSQRSARSGKAKGAAE